MSTSIKVEDTLNEIRVAEGINTDLPIVSSTGATFSGSLSAGGVSTLTTGSAGAFTVNGVLTAKAGITATGNVVAGQYYIGTATGPQIIFGSATALGPVALTAPTGSLFINTNGTGPATRMFVNATGATLWIPFTTSA